MRKNQGDKLFNLFNSMFFIIMSLITLYPFWYTFVLSIIPFHEFAQSTFLIIPRSFDLSAYRQILNSGLMISAYRITVFTTALGTILSLLVTAMAGYALSKRHLPGNKIIFILIIITMLFEGGLIPLYVTISKLKLINRIMIYFLWPMVNTFYVIIMKTYFLGIPQSIEDSAKMDGCNDLSIFFRIIFPISLPIFATIALFYAVLKWNTLTTPLFFIRDPMKYTLQAVLYNIVKSFDNTSQGVFDQGVMLLSEQVKAAAIIVTTIPIVMVYPFLQKYFVKGVLIGAVKE